MGSSLLYVDFRGRGAPPRISFMHPMRNFEQRKKPFQPDDFTMILLSEDLVIYPGVSYPTRD